MPSRRPDDRLVCPLPPPAGTRNIVCRKDNCEWWDSDNCAVSNIAILLREWAEAREAASNSNK
jgi:hypothetical protein